MTDGQSFPKAGPDFFQELVAHLDISAAIPHGGIAEGEGGQGDSIRK